MLGSAALPEKHSHHQFGTSIQVIVLVGMVTVWNELPTEDCN